VFAELDELLDGHHILPRRDDLDLGQPELLVPLDEFAVEVVQVRELLVVQPVTELAQGRPVVLERLPSDARLLVVEESVLGFVRRRRFQAHRLSGYSLRKRVVRVHRA